MKTDNVILRKVINIDGIEKTFNNDEDFINYVREVYKENEEDQPIESTIHWMPENIQQATEYIHEWCQDLELTEE